MPESYPEFFFSVTKKNILPYQERYGNDAFSPALLIIPTGLGKTDAVLLPWLYARKTGDCAAPTRLILVLPRQNLTIQTAANARERAAAANLDIPVFELMAGSEDNDERLRPDTPAILVATQDLYFSRALNRGYARKPPRWPIDFALYNQDALVVLDEIQLMDDALATSTQLAAFRERFGTFGAAPCVWMSATVDPGWLQTFDFRRRPRVIGLEAEDRSHPVVLQRMEAVKALARAPEECRTPAGCAAFALARHRPRTRSLIVANTVARAREIFSSVRKEFPGAVLLHSRFRPGDRSAAAEVIRQTIPGEGQMIVATQVLEAGVDITARLLVTDLAPWGSMVQRFGRVNRYGEDTDAEIWWVDQPTSAKQKDTALPYSREEVDRAEARLSAMDSASPGVLPDEDGPAPYRHVLRKADLLDLFDTAPDISGNHLDVSRFIRATEDKDVYLAWRKWEEDGPPPVDLPDVADDELCPAPIGEFREFSRKHRVYTLNFATDEWVAMDRETPPYPGMVVVTRSTEGGYTASEGWSPESKVPVSMVAAATGQETETDTTDRRSFPTYRQTLRAHTDRVISKLEGLLATQTLEERWVAALRVAARKHDWGKAYPPFQETLHRHGPSDELLAKQCGRGRHERKHLRHELASALAMLQTGDSDLAAYLAAAHHGRIRLSIRSMPGEQEVNGRARARGIDHGDLLPGCETATGVLAPSVTLSLDVMEFGARGGSWTERMLRLRDELGPFRLAYLEMLLRTADEEASGDQGSECTQCPSSN